MPEPFVERRKPLLRHSRMTVLAAVIFAVFIPLPSLAGTSKKEKLDELQQTLAEHKTKEKSLKNETANAEKDLKKTREKLVETSRSVQSNEKSLEDLESRIADLEQKKSELEKTLLEDRKSIASLVLALERIRRVPPEAMIAKPGAPIDTARSAMLMADIMPVLYARAEQLRVNLQGLEDIASDLDKKREKALAVSKSLAGEQKNLEALAREREQLFAKTHDDLRAQQEEVKRISMQAGSLQDLVSRLNRQQGKKEIAALPGLAGHGRLPVSGIVRTRYNDPDTFGAPSKGIRIEARSGALVVAPMAGVVRFAGPFKNYGNMIILEHESGYHSLVAGLEKIDTVVGHNVSAGEAIGFLQQAADGEKPSLYFELRFNGQPVNPARKFAGLG